MISVSNDREEIALRFVLLILLVTAACAQAGLHDPWNELTGRYVVDDRWVDFAAWHANDADRAALDTYIEALATVDVGDFEPAATMAYWLNLYNALTVDLVLENHPVQSIQDLDDPGGRPIVTIGEKTLSLDDIENRILRIQFRDPRLHFALNCGAAGCPPLAAFAFDADALDAQLEEITARAIRDAEWVDADSSGVVVSKIFEWYAEDFGGEEGVRDFIANYLGTAPDSLGALDYSDYDWGLNAPPADSIPR